MIAVYVLILYSKEAVILVMEMEPSLIKGPTDAEICRTAFTIICRRHLSFYRSTNTTNRQEEILTKQYTYMCLCYYISSNVEDKIENFCKGIIHRRFLRIIKKKDKMAQESSFKEKHIFPYETNT